MAKIWVKWFDIWLYIVFVLLRSWNYRGSVGDDDDDDDDFETLEVKPLLPNVIGSCWMSCVATVS